MPAPAGDIGIVMRADIAQLRADLDQARAAMKSTRDDFRSHGEGIRSTIEGLRHPLRGLSEATRGLGAAFGGVKSEAVQAGREILLGFGASGPIGLAMAGLALVVTKIKEAYDDEGAAAKKAAKDAKDDQEAELTNRKKVLQTLRDEVRLNLLKLQGKDPAVEAARDSAAEAQQKATAAAERLQAIKDQIEAAKGEGKAAAAEAAKKIDDSGGVLLVATADVERNRTNIDKLLADKKKAEDDVVYFSSVQALAEIAADEKSAGEKKEIRKKESNEIKFDIWDEIHEKEKARNLEVKNDEDLQRKAMEEEKKRQELLAEERKKALEEQKKEAEVHLREAQSLAASIGQTFTQFLVAPLQKGFQGLATFAEMAKQMLVGLIEKLVAAAVAAAILMFLLPGSSFATNFGAVAGIGQVIGTAVGAGHAAGGLINGPGTGTSDSISARLSAGEYVMPASAVRRWGSSTFDAMSSIGTMNMGDMHVHVGGTQASVQDIERAMRQVATERVGLMGPVLAGLVPGASRR